MTVGIEVAFGFAAARIHKRDHAGIHRGDLTRPARQKFRRLVKRQDFAGVAPTKPRFVGPLHLKESPLVVIPVRVGDVPFRAGGRAPLRVVGEGRGRAVHRAAFRHPAPLVIFGEFQSAVGQLVADQSAPTVVGIMMVCSAHRIRNGRPDRARR